MCTLCGALFIKKKKRKKVQAGEVTVQSHGAVKYKHVVVYCQIAATKFPML